MAKKVKLKVQGLTSSQVQSGAYALILAEADGLHRIPVIVGTDIGSSIYRYRFRTHHSSKTIDARFVCHIDPFIRHFAPGSVYL